MGGGGKEEERCPGETTRSKKRSIVRLSGYHGALRYLPADKRTRDLHTVGEIRSTCWLNGGAWLFTIINVNRGCQGSRTRCRRLYCWNVAVE